VLVERDPSELADLDAATFAKLRLRTHADGEDHDVRRMGLAGFRENLERTACGLFEAGHRVIERERTRAFPVALNQAGAFWIEGVMT